MNYTKLRVLLYKVNPYTDLRKWDTDKAPTDKESDEGNEFVL
jgi:hypothetical protein